MIAILLAALALPAETDASLAQSLVRRLEERQSRAQDMTARFVQSYRSGVLGKEIVERGVVRLKRPGRMLWEYKDPEKKTFLSDGHSYWFYVPADRQVIGRDQDQERGGATGSPPAGAAPSAGSRPPSTARRPRASTASGSRRESPTPRSRSCSWTWIPPASCAASRWRTRRGTRAASDSKTCARTPVFRTSSSASRCLRVSK